MDFAENYSFIVQDAVHGFHWENSQATLGKQPGNIGKTTRQHWESSQATLHPFVMYYKDEMVAKSISYYVISDWLRHDSIAVHVFLSNLIMDNKKMFKINHIHYISYGSAAEFKNFKNFLDLCHYKDFGISAEWNFFATSHGKSPCDGNRRHRKTHSCKS